MAAHNWDTVDAVVIGSGFGGSVAALRLGTAGVDTVVLERGRRWDITENEDTFCTYRNPDGRCSWFRSTAPLFEEAPVDLYAGIMERIDAVGIQVYVGAGVGGGSLVYNGVLYQPPRENFVRVFPPEVDYDEMDNVYYPRVAELLQPSPMPDKILATDAYRATRLFLEQARKAGLPAHLLNVSVDWNVIGQELEGKKQPAAIVGEIWYGINSGAKNSLDRNYLEKAENTRHVEVLPLSIVTAVSRDDHGGFCVSYDRINDVGEVLVHTEIRCRRLFLGAGSMGTTAILLRARETGALPCLNEHIGQGWGNNGDTFTTRAGLPACSPGTGGPAGAVIQDFDNPYAPVSLVSYPQWNAPEGTLTSLGMCITKAKGSFSYNPKRDSLQLTWDQEAFENVKVFQAVTHTYDLLEDANVASSRAQHAASSFTPLPTLPTSALTAHPLGGVVLGHACDLYGRVRGYDGLYVVDSALLPGCTAAANPALTIAAMAERCMEQIIANDLP